jgi:hypothetical protein
MVARKRLDVVKNATRGAVAVDHAASAQRTRWRVVSDGGEIGKQAAALGRGAARRCIAAAAVRTRQRGRGGASGDAGVESWLENGWETTAI